jgi:hypothetical protein
VAIEPRFSTAWEREDYHRQKRGEQPLGPYGDGIPRRAYLQHQTDAEKAIRAAILAVEAMGADTRLTKAVILLGQSCDRVADFVDHKD